MVLIGRCGSCSIESSASFWSELCILCVFIPEGCEVEVCKHLVKYFVFVEVWVPGQGHIYFELVMRKIYTFGLLIINLVVFFELNEQVVKRGGLKGLEEQSIDHG